MMLDSALLSCLKEAESPYDLLNTLIAEADKRKWALFAVYQGVMHQTIKPLPDALTAWLSTNDAPITPLEVSGGVVYPLGQEKVIVFSESTDGVMWFAEWLKLRLSMLHLTTSSQHFEDTNRRMREMESLNNISKLFSKYFGSDAIWSPLLAELSALFSKLRVVVAFWDDTNNTFYQPVLERKSQQHPIIEPLALAVMQSQNILALQDAHNSPAELERIGINDKEVLGGVRSWIGTPLVNRNGDAMGVFCLFSHAPNAYQASDLSVIRAIGAQLSMALDNARLLQQATSSLQAIQTQTNRMASLHRIALMLSNTLDPQEMLTQSAQLLADLFNVDHVGILRLNPNDNNIYFAAEYPDSRLSGIVISPKHSVDYQKILSDIRRNQPIVVTQKNASEVVGQEKRGDMWRNASRSGTTLIMPMVINDQIMGSLGLDSYNPQRIFDEEEIETLMTVAAQIGTALQNAELYEKAVETNHLKNEFLANISHELRTPLNAIIGYTELLANGAYGELNDQQNDRLMRVHRSGKNLLEIINDILDLSKIEAGRMELEVVSLNVEDVVQDVIMTIDTLAEQKGLELQVRVVPPVPSIKADSQRIRQVVTNLLSNAVKFTHKGVVAVTVQLVNLVNHISTDRRIQVPSYLGSIADGHWLMIAVSDSGIGIKPEHQRVIFDAFRQADGSSVREYEGTGLGLAISERLVKMHNGYIWVESTVNSGSTFYVLLPAMPPAEDTLEILLYDDKRPILLVIDDDMATLQLTEDYLVNSGYQVVTSRDAVQALDIIPRIKPATIITDVVMPHIDGWELLRRLKTDPETQHIPIIVQSVLDKRTTGLYLGASEYLIKPINQPLLLETLARFVHIMVEKPILIVDDKNHHRLLMQDVLQSAGYPVEAVNTGEKALEWVKENEPSMLIVDVMMPGISGFEVLRVLRDRDPEQKIPVILTTARDLTVGEKRKVEGLGAQFMGKSQMSGNTLVENVRIALNRRLQKHHSL